MIELCTGLGEIEADGDSLGSKGVGALISKNSDMHIPSTSSQGLDMDIGDMKNSHGAYSQVGPLNIFSWIFRPIFLSVVTSVGKVQDDCAWP